MKWTKFEPCVTSNFAQALRDAGVARMAPDKVWKNSIYTVLVYEKVPVGDNWPAMTWLSIKRNDRAVIHDWRHLQRIKNEVIGPEFEAVELYPAESRLVDEANQYHLWVLRDPTLRFPFGHTERAVGNSADAAKVGAKQRDLVHGYDKP